MAYNNSLYNPNSIMKMNSTGIGSGNKVQSAQQRQGNRGIIGESFGQFGDTGFDYGQFDGPNAYDYNYGNNDIGDMGQTSLTTTTQPNNFDASDSQEGMSTKDLLKGYFPDIDDETLSQYEQFVSPIDSELYDATKQDYKLYQEYAQEQRGFLEQSRGIGRQKLQNSLFTGYEQARGVQAKSGFLSGRNMFSNISEQGNIAGDALNKSFSKGLYDVNQSIVDKIGSARQYYTGLVGQQRGDMLTLAKLTDMFKPDEEE